MTYLLDKCLDIMHMIAQVVLPISKTSGKTSSHCLQIKKKIKKNVELIITQSNYNSDDTS